MRAPVLAFWAAFALGGCWTAWGRPAPYRPGPVWTPPRAVPAPPPEEAPPPLPPILNRQEAVALALRDNPDLKAAFARVEAARARAAAAVAPFLPNVDLELTYLKNYRVPGQRRVPGFNVEAPLYTVGLRATWVLFEGLRRKYLLDEAQAQVGESAAAHADARRLLRLAVAQAFYDALGAREAVRIAAADLRFQQELLEETARRQKAGDRSLSDRLNFEVQVQTARSNLERARSRLETARVVLAELMALPGGRLPASVRLAPLGEEEEELLEPPPEEALIRRALRRRPDLAAEKARLAQARAALGAADAAFWPRIQVAGQTGRQRFFNPRFTTDDTATSLSLEAVWNLFAGGGSLAARREAYAAVRAAEERLARLRLAVISEVRQAAEAVRTAQRQVALQKAKVALSRRTRDLVRREYAAGKASLTRLNEAQRDYVVSEAQLVSERVNLRLAWAVLESAAGE